MESINVLFTSQTPAILLSFENYFRKTKAIHLTTKLLSTVNVIDKKQVKVGDRLKINKESFDLLIIDDDAAIESEKELIKKILTSGDKSIKKILYTSLLDKSLIKNFLNNSVDGVISKRDSFETITECIEHVYHNFKYYSRFIQNAGTKDEKLSHNLPKLSHRENQIINLRISGKTNRQIAVNLNLGVRTIESYLNSARVKLNLAHISDLLIHAAKNLIPAVIPLLFNLCYLIN